MRIALILLALLLAVPAVADAASVAYVENGEVWLSSLDGAQKVRLAAPVVNAEAKTEKWLAVAASDGGRIVAARNVPGMTARSTWFKVWEPNGTSTVEGPMNAPSGWALYAYPLGFDVTPDGHHMIYGYSNSGFCCPQSFAQGTYVRPVSNSPLDPINISGQEDPTLFGSRVIAHSGTTVNVQDPSTVYGSDFVPWLDVSGTGLELHRTEAAANGQLIALELERWQDGKKIVGKIALVATANGVGGDLADPPAVDCYLPASGVATDVSLSQDGRFVAWSDDQGLKVAGAPVSAADPCVLTSPPVVIAAAGNSASMGGADIAAFLPPAPPPPPLTTPPGTTQPPATNTTPGRTATTQGATGSAAKPQLVVTLTYNFNAKRKSTRLLTLAVKNVPAGATVAVTCPKGCAKRSFTKRAGSGSVSLTSLVKGKALKVGATITVTVSKPGWNGVTKILKIRARKPPVVSTRLG
jgi:hypothetical protein